ncbi:NAD-dependent epimerase/dehydratase family protein [Curtobacterium luteum]|uniref:NAD-dependent epimerase/dehydratase family protein n=1 Tax=Curtobacterium luteum TaxID=33881 RepID=UPI0037FC6315
MLPSGRGSSPAYRPAGWRTAVRVLLTGSTGFIGRQLLPALEAAGHEVTTVTRTRTLHHTPAVRADLRYDALMPAVDGHEVVIHAASVTAGSETEMWNGNAVATRRLVEAATAVGARVISMSTTGVYGRSSGMFGDPLHIRRAPSSPLSRSRAAAEDAVFGAGGTVIRPHVVFGPGGRWVVPPLVHFMGAGNAWLGGADIAVAAISTRRLAEGTAALLHRRLPTVIHAAEPEPVPVADLIRSAFTASGAVFPSRVVSVAAAHTRLRRFGVSLNALRMLGESSRMDSGTFWAADAPTTGSGQTNSPARPEPKLRAYP